MHHLLRKSLSYFTIIPERAHRYFKLRINTHLQSPISEILQQEHKKHMISSQQKGALLVALQHKAQKNQNTTFTYLFQSQNQIQPFQFLKQGPFKQHIKDYTLEQIQMQPRMKQKQIAPKHLRE